MYTKILVPLDGSELAECVLPYVKWFTEVSNINEIVFLRVVEPLHMAGDLERHASPAQKKQLENQAAQAAREYLDNVSKDYKDGKRKITLEVLTGKPSKTIAEYVGKSDVDLIIMATHGYSGLHRWVSGSVADELLHAALVPVFLVKPEDRPPH